jgi:hypothetical protein
LNVGLRVQGSSEACHPLQTIPLRSTGSLVSRDITVRSGN